MRESLWATTEALTLGLGLLRRMVDCSYAARPAAVVYAGPLTRPAADPLSERRGLTPGLVDFRSCLGDSPEFVENPYYALVEVCV